MSDRTRSALLRRFGAGLAATVLSSVAVWSFAPQATAHDVVVESNPADGAVIKEFPENIVLEFSGEPREGFNTIAVTDSSGEIVFEGEPELDGRVLTIDVPGDVDAADGTYSVGYQITSSDGHATRGGLEFSVGDDVDDAAATSETDANSKDSQSKSDEAAEGASNTDDGGGIGVANIVISLGAISAALAVIVLLVQKRKRFGEH